MFVGLFDFFLNLNFQDGFFKFQFSGWKREVVNRNVTDSGKRGQCDIYYFTPSGKKLVRPFIHVFDLRLLCHDLYFIDKFANTCRLLGCFTSS